MPRHKRKRKLRPKTPSRVKKRRPPRGGPRTLQHPELWGLGLVALGLFLGSVIYAGWNGGYVGGALAHGLHALIGGASWVVPVAFVALGSLMVFRSALVNFRPFRTGLVVVSFGLMLTLGDGPGRLPRPDARRRNRHRDRCDRLDHSRHPAARCRRAAPLGRLARRDPPPLASSGPHGCFTRAPRPREVAETSGHEPEPTLVAAEVARSTQRSVPRRRRVARPSPHRRRSSAEHEPLVTSRRALRRHHDASTRSTSFRTATY